jgi:hypothetical protein
VRKVVLAIGILGALAASEGLNRFGSMVAALKGGDAPFYSGMLAISVLGAGVLLLALFNVNRQWAKWLTFILLISSAGLMLAAPSFPVNIQIIVGLVISAAATLFIKNKER